MTININSVFWTVQGEGANWGRRALFVRMPFCNLKCSWCDTEFNTYRAWQEEEFRELAQSEVCRFAVLTGGEPMMNKQSPKIIEILKSMGFEIACESNGMFAIVPGIDFVTISPKRDGNYNIHPDALKRADEIKVVVDAGFDLSILSDFESRANPSTRLSLSPEWNEFDKNISTILKFIKEQPRWRVSLQVHKIMGVP